jgi:hypothetical protein
MFAARKAASTLLVLFIPSKDRANNVMAKNVNKIAKRLGAKIIAELPETGGGAFGAARLSGIIAALQTRLVPSRGRRAGRPSDANWVRHPKVPMSAETAERLSQLAEQASSLGRKVSPMQLAAQILEEALGHFS